MNSKLPKYERPSAFTPFLRRFSDERARELSETITLYDQVRAVHCGSMWAQEESIARVNASLQSRSGRLLNGRHQLPS